MNKREEILKKKGYEPSSLNSALLLEEIDKFYDSHDPNDKLLIRDVYLGDFKGEVRKRGFIADVNGVYASLIPTISMDYSNIWYESVEKTKEATIPKVVAIHGEDAVCALKLYDSTTGRKLYDIGIDKQYAANAAGVLKIHGFVVRKKKQKEINTWSVSLL